MLELTTSVHISLGLLTYYAIFFLYDAWRKGSRATNTPNRLVAELRTKYKVNIKTFNRNGDRRDGFSWFNCVWINEAIFKDKERLKFVFFHEMYHLKHRHKLLIIISRVLFALEFILLSFIPWYVFIIIAFSSAIIIFSITMDEKKSLFERKADAYADKMMNADESGKGNKNNK